MLCEVSDSGYFSWCFIQGIEYFKSSKALETTNSLAKCSRKPITFVESLDWGRGHQNDCFTSHGQTKQVIGSPTVRPDDFLVC